MSTLSLALAALTLTFAAAGGDTTTTRLPVAFDRPPRPAPALAPPAADPWLGEDKARHLFMSFALTTMAFGAGRAGGLDVTIAMPVAAGITLGAGIGKEIHDRRSGRIFSTRDLVFDLLGIGLGLTLASYTR
ncbi:MAG TPA: hypothetical protein VJ957_09265 [Longimicrobiales bacterium]|nr:hypothetical protein [Longimicrobiales bacterium]